MISRWLTYLSFACFGVLSLLVLQMTRRPLCIDSKVVERIDKLSDKGSDTIYRCAVNKETPYSAYFGQQAKELGTRIQQTEKLLESIEPFYKKIQITIMDEHPLLYRIQGHHLFIGSKLLEAPGHLEKALAKIWYRERNETLFAQQDLMEEVFTDFLVYLQSGDLDIGDPNTHLTTAIRKVKWPYILKSVPSYCESSWKQSEHFAICQNVADAEGELKEQVTELSLRPLLVSNWIHSYMKLSMKDRYEFVGNLVRILRADHSIPLPMVTEQIMSAMPEKTLVKAAEAIKNTNLFISSSKLAKDSVAHRTFVANLTNELRSSGFQDAFAEASFDVLLVSQEPLSDDSKTFAEFRKIAKAHPELQFALRDQNNLWMLPAQYPIPLATFGQIRANRTIVEKCGGYNFSYVMDYADTTEKLLVVDRCDHSKAVEYGMFLSDGAEGFGIQNKGVAFVQFHLPSLLMKKAELEQVSNVFEFIQKRDVENPSFKSLGWKEVRWSQQANAYQPKAFVDAIEWFRIPGQDRL
ncbi:hypothetical protein [Bdellovibrio sp. NC01]|uniref:hypothetical protein n=1 Tax=Bdellovibrio sp. NC01 TaxID=2220073 RepID=UPI00115B64E9|nr:hypothetical protein [Bdellovibrio sp. NC01]QDK39239.1 hypothetical protein DOE51_17405 [Bdellovibrio sp. NC01]